MKGRCALFFAFVAALMIVQPIPVSAESLLRLIPTGTVNLMEDGKTVGSFRSEMPLPQGMLIASKGSCIVQSQSLQLVAHDEALFALAEGSTRWDLTVKTGRVDFSMRPEVKPVTFHTPHDAIQTERVIIPAGSGSLVRGYLSVTDEGTELNVEKGALQVMTRDGSQLVQPGHSIVLAQAVIVPLRETQPAAVTTGGTGDSNMAAWVVGSVGVAAITAATAWFLVDSGTDFVTPK